MSLRRSPRWLGAAASMGALFLALPIAALLSRVPWATLLPQARSAEVTDALQVSLGASSLATGLSMVLGLPLALWLAAGETRLRRMVRVAATLPMVLPPVVGGVALLMAFGRAGLLAAPLGLALPFTFTATVLAAAFVAMPFFVVSVESSLRARDGGLEEAAATLGATPTRTLITVTLPAVAPAIRAGLLLAWARALGEFGATITFAGNLAGETRTLPLAIYSAMETDPDAALALSAFLILVSGAVLLCLRSQWFPSR